MGPRLNLCLGSGAYPKVATHPENLRSFFDKAARRMCDFKDFPPEKTRAITAPTLVIKRGQRCHPSRTRRRINAPYSAASRLPSCRAWDHPAIMARADLLVPTVETTQRFRN